MEGTEQIYWEYKWQVDVAENALTLSKFFEIPRLNRHFRLGFKHHTDKPSANIFCYAKDLHQIGVRLELITCTCRNGRIFRLQKVADMNEAVTLFEAQVTDKLFNVDDVLYEVNWQLGLNIFTFQFYVTGVGDYAIGRFDELLPEQLWAAAVDKRHTDVEFVVRDRVFPAHRAVLVCRSSVFRNMFNVSDLVESRTHRLVVHADVDPIDFEQFLRFVYTGTVSQPAVIASSLEAVAEQYQVATLATMLRSSRQLEEAFARESASGELVSRPFFPTKPSAPVVTSESPAEVVLCRKGLAVSFELLHPLDKRDDEFRLNVGSRPAFDVKLTSFGAHLIVFSRLEHSRFLTVTRVTVSVSYSTSKTVTYDETIAFDAEMTPVSRDMSEPAMQAFATSIPSAFIGRGNIRIVLVAHLSSTVDRFDYQLVDALCSKEMWAAASDRESTDVELHVRGAVFYAHRAVVAARCPALAHLMGSHRPLEVTLDEIEPPVFRELLHFLYTGTLCEQPMSAELWKAAELYQIDTLKDMGKAAHEKVDLDKLVITLMSV